MLWMASQPFPPRNAGKTWPLHDQPHLADQPFGSDLPFPCSPERNERTPGTVIRRSARRVPHNLRAKPMNLSELQAASPQKGSWNGSTITSEGRTPSCCAPSTLAAPLELV